MADPTYPLFPLFAFLGFLVVLIPLPWHLQAWNSGTCAFMLWTASACLVEFVNAVVWKGNVLNVAPVWCDISTQIMLGSGIGIPASVLCISRRLYKITAIQTVSVTRADKRRDIMIDLGIAVGIPILVLVLHTIVHAHRFDILEDIGCYPVTYSTLLSFFLYYAWPIALGCVSFVYSAFTLRSFFVRRAQFTVLMSSTSLNMNRYIRLMCLSIADMSFTVPLAIYVMYIDTVGIPMAPWISWEDTHYDWNRVEVVPSFLWRGMRVYEITVELTRWLPIFCAFLFFGLFGFASEANKNYKKAFWAVAKCLGRKAKPMEPKFALPSWNREPAKKSSSDSQATLPAYSVSHGPTKPSCSSDVELDLYSPGPEKGGFSPSSYTPSTWAGSTDVEFGSTVHGEEEMDISESPAKADFEDNFKPLPPLPTRDSSPFTFSPYGPPLRHAASMPLPQTRMREGSITVLIEQTTRVDS